MSKTTAAADESVKAAVAQSPEITLTEFCIRLSETVRRPGLIAAFEHVEKRSGNVKGTAEAFQARFESFVKTPV